MELDQLGRLRIGAGATVTEGKVIPDGSLVLGVNKIVRQLTPEEIADLGLDSFPAGEGSDGLALTAGLSSDLPGPRLAFTLVHRQPRLEVRSVTHLLATERVLRARADIQAAVVDRPIEELVLRLPPGAGPAAVVLGEGIKEVALDAADAVTRPRLHPAGSTVHAEPGVDEEGLAELELRGWTVRRWPALHHYFGGASAITRVPWPGLLTSRRRPPSSRARSRIPTMP